MQGLAVIAALLAIGYGFGMAGVLGSLTGLVAALGVGSGLAIAIAEFRYWRRSIGRRARRTTD